MHSTLDIPSLNANPTPSRTIIIGGGIVGASLAFYLSTKSAHHIVLIDKDLQTQLGSTGHAPGFVGQLNESSVLTRLAQDTVSDYLSIPGGFNTVGGLELTSTPSGLETLRRRRDLAKEAGLPAELVEPEEAASLAPNFVDGSSVAGGLFFASDGTADAKVITSYYLEHARDRGVDFLEAAVTGFGTKKGDDENIARIATIRTKDGDIDSENSIVILATGIWTSSLLSTGHSSPITQLPIPIVPVAHPYTFTRPRPPRAGKPSPFVRWLDHHVYARDHGDRDGMGCYNHAPVLLNPDQSAIGAWLSDFEQVLADASSVPKNGAEFQVSGHSGASAEKPEVAGKDPFNGIFAVTPDNLPLVGRVPDVGNLWLCAAIWVTTAAGAAKLLVREILGDGAAARRDAMLLDALSPKRFWGLEPDLLIRRALGQYNDIYNRGAGTR
ncbi:dimethylglycine oxidase [Aspergillus lentulus]|nr:dimethylglycine oxidase [Aspergillus lentulus]